MTDYQAKIKELRLMEKQINIDNNEYGKKIDAKENTVHFERDLSNKLSTFQSDLKQLEDQYKNKSTKEIKDLQPREYDARVKEIHNLLMDHDRMKMKFDTLKAKQYGYKGDSSKYDNYEEDENMKNMGTEELLKYQEEKLQNQDEQIEELIGEAKKGRVMAKQIGENLKDQNEKLEAVDKDVRKNK
ncbi:MAG: SNARE domain-containing protein [archaeon]|nr:SNARE domain-containing protein [archaeon]